MTEFSNYAEMAAEADKYIRELEVWHQDHGLDSKKPWPDHLIASKAKRLAWAAKAKEIFDRGSKRDSE